MYTRRQEKRYARAKGWGNGKGTIPGDPLRAPDDVGLGAPPPRAGRGDLRPGDTSVRADSSPYRPLPAAAPALPQGTVAAGPARLASGARRRAGLVGWDALAGLQPG